MVVSVTDRHQSRMPFQEQIGRIASSGADMIVFREKDLREDEYLALASECAGICSDKGMRFCINTRFDIARRLGIADVQLPMGILREHADELGGLRAGASVHSLSEALEAESLGADHVIFGHVFETTCKPGVRSRGLHELRDICGESGIPVYAIGGITPDNAHSVIGCGAAGVCVMSSVMRAEDPSALIRRIRGSCNEVMH